MGCRSTYNTQVGELRPTLYKIAKKRVHNDAWAEDAVSETIIAALEKPNAYSGRSSLRTWLVGVLKNKLIDQIHRHTRECQASALVEEFDVDFYTRSGCLNEQHAGWGDPEKLLSQQQFIKKVDICLNKLTKQHAQVFKLRYGLEMETSEICHQLGISINNLHVMLYRSRMELRTALQMQLNVW